MNNPKLRFKEFASDWKIDNLSDLSSIIDGDRGKNYPKERDFFDDEFCLFLNAGNVTKLGFDLKNKLFITKEKDQSLRNGKLERNDIVLTTRGTVGNVVLYNNDIPFDNIRINSGMVIVRNKNKIIPEYLYSYMKSPMFESQVNKTNFGSAQPQLTIKGLAKFKVSYPEEKEQIKVSNFLSLLDKKIELQSKKIENLKLFKLYIINQLLSSNIIDTVPISDLGEIVTGTTPSKEKNEYWENGNILWVTPSDITEERDINNSSFKLTESGLEKGRFIPKDSILVTCIASIGKNAVIKNNGSCNQQINAIIPNSNYNYNYIYYLINSISKYMQSIAGTSATSIINKEQFSNILVSVHLKDYQDKIDLILSSFEKKIKLELSKLDKFQNIKKGLMQSMFV